MFLPEGFEVLPGYRLEDTDVVLGKVSGFGSTFLLYGKVSSFEQHEVVNENAFKPSSEDETNILSSQLGVDESIRKLLVELAPKGIKGIVIINKNRGIMTIIQRPPGGSSGGAGVIRTMEFVYKLGPEPNNDEKEMLVLPMMFLEDYDMYPKEVFELVREFNNLLLKELQIINNKRFDNLFASYNSLRERLENIGAYIERVNKEFYDQLLEARTEGILFSEYPILKIQNILTSANNILATANSIKIRLD